MAGTPTRLTDLVRVARQGERLAMLERLRLRRAQSGRLAAADFQDAAAAALAQAGDACDAHRDERALALRSCYDAVSGKRIPADRIWDLYRQEALQRDLAATLAAEVAAQEAALQAATASLAAARDALVLAERRSRKRERLVERLLTQLRHALDEADDAARAEESEARADAARRVS